MAQINEEDVILAFRQTLEEELKRAQEGAQHEPILLPDAPAEANLERLAQAHECLEAEVALLRTVILKLLSQPVDSNAE